MELDRKYVICCLQKSVSYGLVRTGVAHVIALMIDSDSFTYHGLKIKK